jgi:biopolymer transport protein TolR
MGMQAGGSSGLNSEINVTPMVDIMLVLLIIFMLVTPNLQQGVSVDIPTETANALEDKAISSKDAVIISIPEDKQYYLGQVDYPIANLEDANDSGRKRLEAAIKEEMDKKTTDEQRVVYIKSGIGVSYGEVVGIIDVIRSAGITSIGLVADRRAGVTPRPEPQ